MRFVILMIGVFACSTAVIFLKESTWPPVMLAAARLLFAAILLLPFYLRIKARFPELSHRRLFRTSLIPAFMLAVHFMSWIYGVRLTTAANATIIVNLVPLAMPFIMFFMIHETPNRREWLATACAMIGLLIISFDDYHASREHFYGDMISFASMLTLALYLALSRRYRSVSNLWLYVIPVYLVSGCLCLISSLVIDDWSNVSYATREWLLIAALGIVPTIIGHSILNVAMRWFRGQVVSVVNLSQFVFAGLMAWPIFGEIPRPAFYLSCVFIVGAVLVLVLRQQQEE